MHRMYVRWDDSLFLLAQTYARLEPLPTEASAYRALPSTDLKDEVCMVTPAGERLCDFGPTHQHTKE